MELRSGLPESVCSSCLEKIKIAYEIILQCEKSELLLKKSMDCLYQRFVNVVSSASVQDNDTILIVLPESEIINSENEVSKEKSHKTNDVNDNLFVFSLKREDFDNGQLKDFNALNLNHELMKIKNDQIESFDILDLKQETLYNTQEEFYSLDIKQEFVDEESLNDVDLRQDALEVKNVDYDYYVTEDDEVSKYEEQSENSIAEDSVDIFSEPIPKTSNKRVPVFDCTMCNESFVTKGELRLHVSKHPKGTKHVCRICSRSYRKVSILKRHYVTHTDRKKYCCPHCGRTFFHENSLNAHMIFHKEKKHCCSLCDSKFYSKHLLFDHLKVEHAVHEMDDDSLNKLLDCSNKKEPFKRVDFDCTMCTETFKNSDDLKEHKKSHPEGSRHVCKICGKTYLEVSTLRRHLVVHTGKKTYLCPVCGKSFFYRNVLKSHMIYHSEKKHKCHLCEKRFHMRHMLQEHIRMSHSNNRYNYMCEICGKLCSSSRRFGIHKESHNTIYCPTCGKSYRNLRYYKQHLKTHNGMPTPKKSYICDYCGEKRTLKTLLELHILSKHLNERRYSCKLCDKSFFSKGSLSEHEIVHSRKKNETCNICSRILVNRKALILHNRLHTGERPYPCNMCDEKFLSSSRRLAHIKSKHGERTEYCTLCPSKFYLRSDLNKHMLVHYKEPKKAKRHFTTNIIT